MRVVHVDPVGGTGGAQYAYPLASIATRSGVDPSKVDDFSATNQGRSIGLGTITALSDSAFLVMERDNRGVGVDFTATPIHKRVCRIKLTGASDIHAASLAGSKELPAGVIAASKLPEVELREVDAPVPEKIEGLAIGPRLQDGSNVVMLGADNDDSVTQTGAGEQFYVRISPDNSPRTPLALDAPCPAVESLLPAYLLSFKLRAGAPSGHPTRQMQTVQPGKSTERRVQADVRSDGHACRWR